MVSKIEELKAKRLEIEAEIQRLENSLQELWSPSPWTIDATTDFARIQSQRNPVATVFVPPRERDLFSECAATIRLISKAPEMVEIIEELLATIDDLNGSRTCSDWQEVIEANKLLSYVRGDLR